ncbi:MAG: toll/interleukin-1 receptor domain-containing protein [Nitrospirae bacterium]|nr:toll/interleukin-1 receptor domain-containing protein [Magnetococcales bacterium]HAT49101.1 hypothetical protein [Alphaproteobacteria bacterium]
MKVVQKSKVFISYSHADEGVLGEFLPFRKNLEDDGVAQVWVDHDLKAGDKWRKNIEKELRKTQTAILFISEHFLASHFIKTCELPPILSASEQGRLTVLPVFLSPSSVGEMEISFIHPDSGSNSQIKLTEFQGFGTLGTTLEELQPVERKRKFLELSQRIRELAK